jgi:hypothetical protein
MVFIKKVLVTINMFSPFDQNIDGFEFMMSKVSPGRIYFLLDFADNYGDFDTVGQKNVVESPEYSSLSFLGSRLDNMRLLSIGLQCPREEFLGQDHPHSNQARPHRLRNRWLPRNVDAAVLVFLSMSMFRSLVQLMARLIIL